MNGPTCYAPNRVHVWGSLTIAATLALVACSTPPVPSVRAQGPHIVELGKHRMLVRPQGVAVKLTYLTDADPPAWIVAWPATAPATTLRLGNDDGELVLERLDDQGEPEQRHAFAVTQNPRGQRLGIDVVARYDGSYSLSQVLGGTADVASASFGTVETLSTVRVGGR